MSEINIIGLAGRIPDEASAYEYLETLRWPDGPECPHCGNTDKCYFLKPRGGNTRATRTGAPTQRRLWKCGSCRKQFSVLTDTVMHGTKIAIRKWVFVIFEMCASKNGVSAREIERKYDLTPRSAWFMAHRIREAMRHDGLGGMFTGRVIADETYIGGKPSNRHGHQPGQGGQGRTDKTPVLSLVSRETGEVRSTVIPDVTGTTLRKAIAEQVDLAATDLHTDAAKSYVSIEYEFASHQSVNHEAREWVRGDVTTNHAEGYFSQLKRSIDGTHHHVTQEHLGRYLAEFDFRYSTRKESDTDRMGRLVGQVGGRRLAYEPHSQASPWRRRWPPC